MSGFERQMVGARGGGYGLDAELARKKAAQYDYKAEAQAADWVETVTEEKLQGTFGEALKDGVVLCRLVNVIRPGVVKRINESRMPFKQMENISNFLKACRSMGVVEHSLFETVDLFEEKDLGLVVQCLFALGSAVQVSCPEFDGPHLGARQHTSNKREWTEEQKVQARLNAGITKQNAGSSEVMERLPTSKAGITFGAETAGIGDVATVPQWSQGSHGIMDRQALDASRSITFGAENAGVGDASVPTQWAKGSYGIMDRSTVSKANDITFGADSAGVGDTSTVAKTSMGSQGVMDRTTVSNAGSVTFGADSAGMAADGTVTKAAMGSAGVMERSEVTRAADVTFGADSAKGGTLGERMGAVGL